MILVGKLNYAPPLDSAISDIVFLSTLDILYDIRTQF